MCTFRPPKDQLADFEAYDSKLIPYTGGCARIDLLPNRGHLYINMTKHNQLLELPFPGPSFQTARIWMIAALALDMFGGGIILVKSLKETPRWILASYAWFISIVLQILSCVLVKSCFGNFTRHNHNDFIERIISEFSYGPGMEVSICSIIGIGLKYVQSAEPCEWRILPIGNQIKS